MARARLSQESLEAHGIPFDETLVATGGFDELEAAAAVSQWLLDGFNLTRSSLETTMPRLVFHCPAAGWPQNP